jgi:hypothetical protein
MRVGGYGSTHIRCVLDIIDGRGHTETDRARFPPRSAPRFAGPSPRAANRRAHGLRHRPRPAAPSGERPACRAAARLDDDAGRLGDRGRPRPAGSTTACDAGPCCTAASTSRAARSAICGPGMDDAGLAGRKPGRPPVRITAPSAARRDVRWRVPRRGPVPPPRRLVVVVRQPVGTSAVTATGRVAERRFARPLARLRNPERPGAILDQALAEV